jgi:polysaccharide biosynthesis protein PslG
MFIRAIFLSVCIVFLLNPVKAQAQTACPADENRFGVVEQLTWRFLYSAENMPTALELMQAAGIGWVRVNWSWKDMQPQLGAFDFSQFDLAAQMAADYDIQLLPILLAVPAWASSAPPELIAEWGSLSPVDKYRPRDRDEWLTYVRTVVERYDGDGLDDAPGSPRMHYWEVWNEENLSQYWPPQPDVTEYFELLQATYTVIKEVDPTAKVVLGGLSGSGVNAEGSGYLQQLYRLGAGDYFDVMSIHHYIHPEREGNIEALQASLAATRQVMDNNGDSAVPLWLTEIGWSDAPNAWGQPTAAQDEIAAFLTRVYTELPADKIFWYNFRNVFDDSPEVEHNFGLIHNDFTTKPSYEALASLAAACH